MPGSPRSTITRSGRRCSQRCSAASPSGSATRYPRAGEVRRHHSPRRLVVLDEEDLRTGRRHEPSPVLRCGRHADRDRQAAEPARRRSDRPAHRLDEAANHGQPEPDAAPGRDVSPARDRSDRRGAAAPPVRRPARRPRPGSPRRRRPSALTRISASGALWVAALSMTLARAWLKKIWSTWTAGRSSGIRTLRRAGAGAIALEDRVEQLPSGVTSSSVASAPDWMRLMSRSEPTSRLSRSASSSIAARSLAAARRRTRSSDRRGFRLRPGSRRAACAGRGTPSREGPIAARRCGGRPRHRPPPRRGGRAEPPGPPGRPSQRATGSPRSSGSPHRPARSDHSEPISAPSATSAIRYSPGRLRGPPAPRCGSGPTSPCPRDAASAGRSAFRPSRSEARMRHRRSGAPVATVGAEADPRARHPGIGTDPLQHRVRSRSPGVAPWRAPGRSQRGHEPRARAARPGCSRSRWGARESADDDADEQQQEEGDQLLRTSHGEREPRLDEQEVVDDERAGRGQQCRRRALPDRNDGDAEQVDAAGVVDAQSRPRAPTQPRW